MLEQHTASLAPKPNHRCNWDQNIHVGSFGLGSIEYGSAVDFLVTAYNGTVFEH